MKTLPILLLVIVFLGGCFQPAQLPPEELEYGLVYMFPGIEGGYWSLNEARRAFRDAGVESAIYTHEWKYPFFWLGNLMDYPANRDAAQKAAQRIVEYQREYPGRPVDLVGYSGGGGLAVPAAGRTGFDVVRAVPDDKLRSKLKQCEWSFDSLGKGHLGGHLTIAFYQWNRDEVAKSLVP